MKKIILSMDTQAFWSKPIAEDVKLLSLRIPKCIEEVGFTRKELRCIAESIGVDGCTFCPATFVNNRRSQDTFEQQQFFVLDFDNKDPARIITVKEVMVRAQKCGLRILFIYETFSSVSCDKFRVVFLNDISIDHRKIAEAMQLALGTIFPEADASCYRDVSKMYFGGKGLVYFDDSLPVINIESLFRGLTNYFRKKFKPNHYKEKIAKFSKETGICLTKSGLLDISVTDDPTELLGATHFFENGKKSPLPIIYPSNIKGDGEIFPYDYYCIRMKESTSVTSVATDASKTDVVKKVYKNHKQYRSKVLSEMQLKCRLFAEFSAGRRDFSHNELFGLATNLLHVEKGIQTFKEIQFRYPEFYDDERRDKWVNNLRSFEDYQYQPTKCSKYCPYHNECKHNASILSTIQPKPGTVEWVEDYCREYFSVDEVQNDTYDAIHRALLARDCLVHTIKAMTAVGKTTILLKLMEQYFYLRFLIAAPTNLLKNEIYEKAVKKGLEVRKTPSLEEIKDEIPKKVWTRIQKFYASGQYGAVHPYITELLKKEDIPCLREYMEEREELKTYTGSIITTHRYLLSMDEKRLQEYDAVIIDEDILFKSVLSNQGEITVSALKKLMKEPLDSRVRNKIAQLLKLSKTQSKIQVEAFDYDEEDGSWDVAFDLPSFCKTEKFYVRRKNKKLKLHEDTVSYIKPATFFDGIKYIIVSATANEDVYCKYFGEDRVDFYECKMAKYEGVLLQDPLRSYSRSYVEENPKSIDQVMHQLEICDWNHVITFLKYSHGALHYGNTEGSNILEGQEILVIGTPYHADFLYKLAAFTMGLDFDDDEEMNREFIEYEGRRFWLNTFANEDLRSIQCWMIESELEQAVGRARLLRNSCTVYLFSNFVLNQATIKNMSEDEND